MNLNKLLCLCVLCLLICLDTCPHVFLCIFSSLNCLNFPHSPTAFISIELPKQLHPSTKNPGTAGHPHKYTHCVILTHTYTHFFSAQPLSNPLVSIPGGIGLNNGMMGRVLFGGLGGKWNPPQGDL